MKLKEILTFASKFKQASYNIDAFRSMPDEDREKVEKMCANFSMKCKHRKPSQLNPTDTPLIIGMLLMVDNGMLRDAGVHKQEKW